MSSRVFLNGEFAPKLDAKLSVYDHGLLYGDGVWEGMRLVHGHVFRLHKHIEALQNAAKIMALPLPGDAEGLATAVRTAIAGNTRRTGYVRVIVTRGPGTVGLDPRKCDPQLVILVDDVVPFPADLYGHGLHALTAQSVRLDAANPLHRIRSLSHGHMVLAKAEALRSGLLEAVLLTRNGAVARGTEGVLFVVKNGTIRTPPANDTVLGEVLCEVVRERAAISGVAFEEVSLTTTDLLEADEVFLAGTTVGLIGLVRLDGVAIGTGSEGPATRTMRDALHQAMHGTDEAPIVRD